MANPARKAQQQTAITDRRQQVAALLRGGWQQIDIAAHLGVSEATISGDVNMLTGQWRTAAAKDYEQVVTGALAALDVDEAQLRAMLDGKLTARERVLVYEQIGVIQDRRAKWRGYDAPPKQAAGVADLDLVLIHIAEAG